MRKFYVIIFLAMCLVLALSTGACTTATPQPAPAPAPAPSPSPTPPASSQVTAGQLADQGRTVFANCAGCHGQNGEGLRAPAIIGSNAQLAKYSDAKQLFTYINTTMPTNAPGSLSQEQYLQVLSYLLLQNKFVSAETAINSDQLDSVQLK